jgi:hypothetical protein
LPEKTNRVILVDHKHLVPCTHDIFHVFLDPFRKMCTRLRVQVSGPPSKTGARGRDSSREVEAAADLTGRFGEGEEGGVGKL